jgi:ATP-dependent RNA helicase RhlE
VKYLHLRNSEKRFGLENFNDLGLIEPLRRALETAGYQAPSPIQRQAIPWLLSGRDMMGCAQTGTGKTAAFALPTLQRLLETRPQAELRAAAGPSTVRTPGRPRHIRALVLAPTRELAAQIAESFENYGQFLNLRVALVHGGVSQNPQVRLLQRGVDILVATPGRMLDLMDQRYVDLSRVEILILDEADQMFDMGFLPDVKKIVAKVSTKRQSLMFSATMPPEIRELAKSWLKEPKHLEVARVASTAAQISQTVFHVSPANKPVLLVEYMKCNAVTRSIVFTRTKHGADKLVKVLQKSGIEAVAIHGNKSQNARTRHLEQFKSNCPPVLVATDIAARGIDVSGVSHVINYELPDVPELYVHRVGRTGRAAAVGTAVSFCAPDERNNLSRIERLINAAIDVDAAHASLTLSVGSANARTNLHTSEPAFASAGRGANAGRPRRQSPARNQRTYSNSSSGFRNSNSSGSRSGNSTGGNSNRSSRRPR